MTLINFTKEELSKIEYYLLGETDPIVVSILEKISNLDEVCECNNSTKCQLPLNCAINVTRELNYEQIHLHSNN